MRLLGATIALIAMLAPARAQITTQQSSGSNYSFYYPVNPPYAGACLIGAPPGMPLQWGSCTPTLNNQAKTLFPATDAYGRQNVSAMLTNGQYYANVVAAGSYPAASSPALQVIPSPMPSLQCPYVVGISQTADTQVVTNPGGAHIHVCTFAIINAGAQTASLVEGTGSTCATGTSNLYGQYNSGSGTASFAANGGTNIVSSTVTLPMQKAGDNLCVVQSASNNVSGTITYGIYP